MKELLIKNAHLLDTSCGYDGVCHLLVRDGKIAQIDAPDTGAYPTLDAKGMYLVPGLVDMHVHLRDPGYTHKEDIPSGCAAAAAGGFTSLASMPNSNPVCDNPDVVKYIIGRSAQSCAKVYPVAAITQGLKSEQLTELDALRAAGAVGISDDGRPVTNNRLMLAALKKAREQGLCVICHAEDLDIVDGGIMHKGKISEKLGVKGIDRASEDSATASVIALAGASDTAIHIAHVSTAGSVAVIRDAKRRGVKVTCETAPHYFTLTDQQLISEDANFRMNPPLREEADRRAILEGIADGTIDCIATDHAPHAPHEKADFQSAPNGVIGLETSLAVCLTKLVHRGVISLGRLIEMMTSAPARILGIEGGSLREGAAADLALFDLNEQWTVNRETLCSKSQNTCFDKMPLTGRVRYTLLDGEITYQA